ncbi:unnamed protein product [Ostreobium quekettii]|uniref:BZIP domain-containing protein n=1 Tax=Ostreobium quekettii TaxID=121088 RepID=A0A8S1IM11_9CHLO|nr:unnamed protein product [Ostreobium quekettii]|eukprot:evm.model.scf_829.3 EVM.evm.TU.scf_829.3   scf_829:31027-33668(+)
MGKSGEGEPSDRSGEQGDAPGDSQGEEAVEDVSARSTGGEETPQGSGGQGKKARKPRRTRTPHEQRLNRLCQQRYRERQKKKNKELSKLTSIYEERTREYVRLEKENELLRATNARLQAIAVGQGESIESLSGVSLSSALDVDLLAPDITDASAAVPTFELEELEELERSLHGHSSLVTSLTTGPLGPGQQSLSGELPSVESLQAPAAGILPTGFLEPPATTALRFTGPSILSQMRSPWAQPLAVTSPPAALLGGSEYNTAEIEVAPDGIVGAGASQWLAPQSSVPLGLETGLGPEWDIGEWLGPFKAEGLGMSGGLLAGVSGESSVPVSHGMPGPVVGESTLMTGAARGPAAAKVGLLDDMRKEVMSVAGRQVTARTGLLGEMRKEVQALRDVLKANGICIGSASHSEEVAYTLGLLLSSVIDITGRIMSRCDTEGLGYSQEVHANLKSDELCKWTNCLAVANLNEMQKQAVKELAMEQVVRVSNVRRKSIKFNAQVSTNSWR